MTGLRPKKRVKSLLNYFGLRLPIVVGRLKLNELESIVGVEIGVSPRPELMAFVSLL